MATPNDPLFQDLQESLRTMAPVEVGNKFADISSFFRLPAQARQSTAGANASTSAATTGLRKQDELNRYDTQRQVDELQARKTAIGDAASAKSREASLAKSRQENYQRMINASGGYDFFDPDGKKITPFEYSRATGNSLDKVLTGSFDPDQATAADDYTSILQTGQLLRDYVDLDPGLKSKSNVKKLRKRFEAKDPSLTDDELLVLSYEDMPAEIRTSSPQDLVNNFYKTYPGVFGGKAVSPITGSAPQPQPEEPGFFQRIQDTYNSIFRGQ